MPLTQTSCYSDDQKSSSLGTSLEDCSMVSKGRQHFIKDRRRAETTNGERSIHPRRTIVTKAGQALGTVD